MEISTSGTFALADDISLKHSLNPSLILSS
jgi:hypothetical protein